jgi:hypothetical protein
MQTAKIPLFLIPMNPLLLLADVDPATSSPTSEHPVLVVLLTVIIIVRIGLAVLRGVMKFPPGSPVATLLKVMRWALVIAALVIIVVIDQKK